MQQRPWYHWYEEGVPTSLDADEKTVTDYLHETAGRYPDNTAVVFENCSRYNMSPHLVYAMIREESRFYYRAVSRAGAVGLMQLMPATGEQVASELGFPTGVRQSLLVPEINLTFGVWYASRLLTSARGDSLMMLAAYNAGMGNARRWFEGNGAGGNIVDAVNGIDFKETRGYVKRIVESAHVYHSHYFDPSAADRLDPGR